MKLIKVTEEDIINAYNYHCQPNICWVCSSNNPIALALNRLGYDYSVTYREVSSRHQEITADGMKFFSAHQVTLLPEKAVSFMRQFGYSLSGKESKENLATRKELHKTSSDFNKPVAIIKQNKEVQPFEFELNID